MFPMLADRLATLSSGIAGFFTGKLVRGSLFVGGLATPACYFTLSIRVHQRKTSASISWHEMTPKFNKTDELSGSADSRKRTGVSTSFMSNASGVRMVSPAIDFLKELSGMEEVAYPFPYES